MALASACLPALARPAAPRFASLSAAAARLEKTGPDGKRAAMLGELGRLVVESLA